jgi:hypothetical protein
MTLEAKQLRATGATPGLPLVVSSGGVVSPQAAAAEGVDAALPRWKKFTVDYTDLAAAALTNDIEVYSLVAGEIIHGVKIKHSTAFSGGTITDYTVSIGIAGDLVKYASAFDVFQAVDNQTFQLSSTFGSENHGAATSIRIAAVAIGDDLDQATDGEVDVWLLVSRAV